MTSIESLIGVFLSVIVLFHGACAASIDSYDSDDMIGQLPSEREAEIGQLPYEDSPEEPIFEGDVEFGQAPYRGGDVAYQEAYYGDAAVEKREYEVVADSEDGDVVVEPIPNAGDDSANLESEDSDAEAYQAVDLGYDVPYEVGYAEDESEEVQKRSAPVDACAFTCETGTPVQRPRTTRPLPKDGRKPKTPSNPSRIKLQEKCSYLSDCRAKRMSCYWKCGVDRATCDEAFAACSTQASTGNLRFDKICSAMGGTYRLDNKRSGCEVFLTAQTRACVCQ